VRHITALGRDNVVLPGQISSFGAPEQQRN
jgi:hypothetical protein